MRFWGVRLVSIALAIGACLALQSFEGHRGDYEQRIVVLVGLYMGMLREGKGMRTADRAAAVVRVLLDGIAKERSPLP